MPFNLISKFLISYQHFLYYPVMSFARWNLNAQSLIMHLKQKEFIPFRILDFFSIIGYWVWLIYVLSFLPDMKTIIMFLVVSYMIAGILNVQITLSHFAMPVNEGLNTKEFDYNFVKLQFETSMDVDCSTWMDWFHGGLQFQVPHHLFPRIPRHNLRHVRDKYVIPFAKKWKLNYQMYPFYEANIKVLKTLKETSTKAKIFINENQ